MMFSNVFCIFHRTTENNWKYLNYVFLFFVFWIIFFKSCFLKTVFKNNLPNNFWTIFLFLQKKRTKKSVLINTFKQGPIFWKFINLTLLLANCKMWMDEFLMIVLYNKRQKRGLNPLFKLSTEKSLSLSLSNITTFIGQYQFSSSTRKES